MFRLGACAFAVCALSGCPESSEKPSASSGLKVSLPKGWVAQEAGLNALVAGPPGHGVLRLEKQGGGSVPSAAELEAVFAEQKAKITKKESGGDFVGYQYSLSEKGDDKQTAMLGFRRVSSSVFRCSSTPVATPAEMEQAFEACRTME